MSMCARRLAAAMLVVAMMPAWAEYPAKPIHLVVTFSAGGTADLAARAIGEDLAERLGQTIVVDNRAGGDSAIGTEAVIKAAPDGYTLLFGSPTGVCMVPAVRTPPPYDPVRDLTSVSMLGSFGFFLFTTPSLPVSTVGELIEYARANPGKLNAGTANSIGILVTALFVRASTLDIVTVPYKGEAQAVPDLVAGHIQLLFNPPGAATGFVRDGKLRVLATLLDARSPLFPEAPTPTEAKLPTIPLFPFAGLFGPAGLPQPVVERLAREVAATLASAKVRAKLDSFAFEGRSSTPQQLATLVKEQVELWRTTAREVGLVQK